MDKQYFANHWKTLCNSARKSASQLGQDCSAMAKTMMHAEASKFCSQKEPATRGELNTTYTRRMTVSTRLTAIKRADALANAHPRACDMIFAEVRKLCEVDFAENGESFIELQRMNLELTERIAEICYADAAGPTGR